MARILILLSILLRIYVNAQAPSDADQECVKPSSFRVQAPTYDDNQVPLLESRYYETLIGNGGVWTPVAYDTNGGGWANGLGGICFIQVRSCTNSRSLPQENYLFTQFVSRLGANEFFLQVSYQFSTRTRPEFDVVLYEHTGMDHAGSVNRDKYTTIRTVKVENNRFSGSIIHPFVPKENTTGFYLGFRENGTCVTLTRVLVYANACPKKVVDLTQFPQTFSPTRDSGEAIEVHGQCLPNSSVKGGRSDSPLLKCAALGAWISFEDCECNPGYKLEVSEGLHSCQACPSGTYKAKQGNDVSCIPCPLNSNSSDGASYCVCKDEFYRSSDEDLGAPCTAPPSAPPSCEVTDIKNNSITVEWDMPANDGGREDVCFDVFYQKSSQLHEDFLKAASCISQVHHTVTNLNPLTEYTIRITSENGVSNQSMGTKQLRTVQHVATTTEGVPEKITVFARRRGSTLTWQPPTVTNGNVVGFQLRVYREGREEEATLIEFEDLEFCYSPGISDMPAGDGAVFAQILAKTAVGAGEWSNAIELPETVIATPAPSILCASLEAPPNGRVVQTGVSVGSLATYSCNSPFQLVGSSTRQCQSDGSWSNGEPSCEATSTRCNLLPAPAFGSVTQSGIETGSTAIYTCNDGFQVMGVTNRVCQVDGTWSGSQPVCQTACASLLDPINGEVNQLGTTFGSRAVYSCNTGFVMDGTSVRFCSFDGTWTSNPPTCYVVCESLRNPPNGIVTITRIDSSTNKVLPGSQAVYSCNGGFEISGNGVRDCQPDGTWSGSEPTCRVPDRTCNSLSNPQNGRVIVTGGVALYVCNDAHNLQGNATRICINGQWSGVEPTCVQQPLRFELNGVAYPDGSRIRASDIGAGENCLRCITDKTDCCGTLGSRAGEFYKPDGSRVPTNSAGDILYRNRGSQYICLNKRQPGTVDEGEYRCEIPDASGTLRSLHITITN